MAAETGLSGRKRPLTQFGLVRVHERWHYEYLLNPPPIDIPGV